MVAWWIQQELGALGELGLFYLSGAIVNFLLLILHSTRISSRWVRGFIYASRFVALLAYGVSLIPYISVLLMVSSSAQWMEIGFFGFPGISGALSLFSVLLILIEDGARAVTEEPPGWRSGT
jgi:hypothetical protein